MLALLVACAPPGDRTEPAASGSAGGSHTAAVIARGTLRLICFPHQENPFVHVNLALGPMPRVGGPDHFQGIDVELTQAVAESLGVSLEVHPVSEPSYAALIPDLLAGRGDLVASSFSITPARDEQVDFSDPYYHTERVIIARRGAPIAAVDDLRDKVGVAIPGSTHEAFLRDLGLPPEQLLTVGFTRENLSEVAEGRADFTSADATIEPLLRKDFKGLDVVLRLPGDDRYGVAVPPGSDLVTAVNRVIAELQESGKLQEIIRRQFAATLPSG